MGCDIHMYREAFRDGKWVAVDNWTPCSYDESRIEVKWSELFTDRNYDLFGFLCKGVRRDFDVAFEPRGLPISMSDEVSSEAGDMGRDGHSHSYLSLRDLKDGREYLKGSKTKISGMKDAESYAVFMDSINSEFPDYSLLYPYCQWSSNASYIQFEVEIPSIEIMGDAFDRIIGMFDGVEGEDHRVVFWFDN